MKFLSLFSGIEAASMAWENLGWQCVAVAEIDPFPCEVLKHHYPNVPNLGSVTNITKEKINELKQKNGTIDVVVGGSPCQSFSVAGKRLGLDDPRGNLMLDYCRIVATVRPKYFVWENVPGALSSNKGRDFACLLEEMANIGYSLGWRVLDAQHFGVPQRRRRVFLVGCLGDKRAPAKILFEHQSRSRHLAPCRKTRQKYTHQTQTSSGEYDQITLLKNNRSDGNLMENATKCYTLTAAMGNGGGHVPMIIDQYKIFTQNSRDEIRFVNGDGSITGSLSAQPGAKQQNYLYHYTYNVSSYNSAGMRSKNPNVGFKETTISRTLSTSTDPSQHQGGVAIVETPKNDVIGCLDATGASKLDNQWANSNQQIIETTICRTNGTGLIGCLNASDKKGISNTYVESNKCIVETISIQGNLIGRVNGGPEGIGVSQSQKMYTLTKRDVHAVSYQSKVRKLTPIECERLQGFPDNFTRIPWKGRAEENCPDSHRYKALGNSMAVPVMKFIGIGIMEAEGKPIPQQWFDTPKPLFVAEVI